MLKPREHYRTKRISLAALIFLAGILRGKPWPEMFMAAIALAVGAIPEGLAAVVTITLAIGVGRMVRRHAIIRKLPAVETLGSTTVICSDKTGTLTQNQMTVQEIHAGGRLYHVTGSGYEADGKIHYEQAPVVVGENVALIETLGAGLLCNDSRLVRNDEGQIIVQGDPTEAALIVAAQKAGLAEKDLSGRLPRLETIPFESEYRHMATLHGAEDEPKIIYIKGVIAGILATWLAQLAFTYLPLMNQIFHTAPVRAEAWLYIVAIGVFTSSVVELEKWIRFRALPQQTRPAGWSEAKGT